MKSSNFFVLSAVLFVAACGASSSSNDVDEDVEESSVEVPSVEEPGIERSSVEDVSLNEIITRYDDFLVVNGVDEFFGVDIADIIPTSGTANYSGMIFVGENGIVTSETFGAYGAVALTVAFSDETTIAGEAGSFFQLDDPFIADVADATGDPIEGSATIDFGQVSGANSFEGSIVGSVSPLEGGEIAFDMDALGVFTHEDAKGFVGFAGDDAAGVDGVILATED